MATKKSLVVLQSTQELGTMTLLLDIPNWRPAIPPHAAIKSPFSVCFKLGVQGEWSETTIDIVPSLMAAHKASYKRYGSRCSAKFKTEWILFGFAPHYYAAGCCKNK